MIINQVPYTGQLINIQHKTLQFKFNVSSSSYRKCPKQMVAKASRKAKGEHNFYDHYDHVETRL
jgi:hypothetical protein